MHPYQWCEALSSISLSTVPFGKTRRFNILSDFWHSFKKSTELSSKINWPWISTMKKIYQSTFSTKKSHSESIFWCRDQFIFEHWNFEIFGKFHEIQISHGNSNENQLFFHVLPRTAHKKCISTSGAKHSPPFLSLRCPSGKFVISTSSMIFATFSKNRLNHLRKSLYHGFCQWRKYINAHFPLKN